MLLGHCFRTRFPLLAAVWTHRHFPAEAVSALYFQAASHRHKRNRSRREPHFPAYLSTSLTGTCGSFRPNVGFDEGFPSELQTILGGKGKLDAASS